MHFRLSFGALLLLAVSACASGYGDTPDNPIRIVRPTREQIMAEFPPDALARRITGRATVECEVIAGGLLDHCFVQEEDPPGYGFGNAAIRLAFEHSVRPDAEGRLPVGRKVDLPIEFTLPR
jgi:periplasmic protein TonB